MFTISDGQTLFVFNYDGRVVCEIKVPGNGTTAISKLPLSNKPFSAFGLVSPLPILPTPPHLSLKQYIINLNDSD